MSRKCPITGKGPLSGKNVSHSMRHTCRRWNVNMQKTTIVIDGKKQTLRVSTSGLRNLRKAARASQLEKANQQQVIEQVSAE